MLYRLDYPAEVERGMAEQARRTDGRLPERVLNAPEIDQGLELYWTAFTELNTCRPPALSGLPPIPWNAIHDWARAYGLDQEQEDRLHYILSVMDKAMAKWQEKRDGDKSKSRRVRSPRGANRRAGTGRGRARR